MPAGWRCACILLQYIWTALLFWRKFHFQKYYIYDILISLDLIRRVVDPGDYYRQWSPPPPSLCQHLPLSLHHKGPAKHGQNLFLYKYNHLSNPKSDDPYMQTASFNIKLPTLHYVWVFDETDQVMLIVVYTVEPDPQSRLRSVPWRTCSPPAPCTHTVPNIWQSSQEVSPNPPPATWP